MFITKKKFRECEEQYNRNLTMILDALHLLAGQLGKDLVIEDYIDYTLLDKTIKQRYALTKACASIKK